MSRRATRVHPPPVLLTDLDRPLRWQWGDNAPQQLTPDAAPNWTVYSNFDKYRDPIIIGGKDKLGTCQGRLGIYTSSSVKIGARVVDGSNNVIATGAEDAAASGTREISLSGDATSMQAGSQLYRIELQTISGTPDTTKLYGYILDWGDA